MTASAPTYYRRQTTRANVIFFACWLPFGVALVGAGVWVATQLGEAVMIPIGAWVALLGCYFLELYGTVWWYRHQLHRLASDSDFAASQPLSAGQLRNLRVVWDAAWFPIPTGVTGDIAHKIPVVRVINATTWWPAAAGVLCGIAAVILVIP
ncbi:hypothetical protein [Paramicrobacterium agarici]|uniref:Uncharacterized protein n=1 Tax=Paramicrobacterium agarici TaxID=630514 RepID=A0A2A9DSV9_9MICO|nr:hypothetical protein [Microbacterium agarici]PFG29778.1 hypothetical protein ATJ78_0693 [Microbacterium agarici]